MRCRFCGSSSIHQDKQHETFSGKKAVAGALAVGPVGAAAGFIGKNKSGYRCSQCGAFMEQPMEFTTELGINSAIREAESGGDTSVYEYYKRQYANISANIPQKQSIVQQVSVVPMVNTAKSVSENSSSETVKNIYRYLMWNPDCPIQIENIIITTDGVSDSLSLLAFNQGEESVRSVYMQVSVKDDTGDVCNTVQCVYQGLSVEKGKYLPETKRFSLGTDLAYEVEIHLEKIALANGEVWRASDEEKWYKINPCSSLNKENFPFFKYAKLKMPSYISLPDKDEIYLPSIEEDYWQCICGATVKKDCCPKCSAVRDTIVDYMSQKNLSEIEHKELRKIARERFKALSDLRTKAIAASNQKIYDHAMEAKKADTEESLNQASKLFESISDYKDSVKKAQECKERIPVLLKEIEEKRIQEEKEKAAQEEQRKREEAIQLEKAKKTRKILAIASGVAVVCIAIALLVTKVIIPGNHYKSAKALLEEGKYKEAITTLEQLDGYKDSKEIIVEASKEYATEKCGKDIVDAVMSAEFGSILSYGLYDMDGNFSNGREAMEWYVIDKSEDGLDVLLLSKEVIEIMGFYPPDQNKDDSTCWTNSALRKWMQKFALNAFNAQELDMVKTTSVEDGRSYEGVVDDKFFALSKEEAEALEEKNEKILNATASKAALMKCRGKNFESYMSEEYKEGCDWWLRDVNYSNSYYHASTVCHTDSGSFASSSEIVDHETTGVRPAMWLSLKPQ